MTWANRIRSSDMTVRVRAGVRRRSVRPRAVWIVAAAIVLLSAGPADDEGLTASVVVGVALNACLLLMAVRATTASGPESDDSERAALVEQPRRVLLPESVADGGGPAVTAVERMSPSRTTHGAESGRRSVANHAAVPGVIRLLGRYEVEGPEGRVIGDGARTAWGLIGLLAEFGDSGLARASAYARMWPDADPREDRELFWRPMREVRVKLCEALGRPGRSGAAMVQNLGASTYRINPGLFTCDVWELRNALATARRLGGTERTEALERAIELYTGSYMPGSPYEFAQNASLALDREVVRALVQLADGQEDAERALLYLEQASAIEAVDEYLYWRRMQIHADLGQVHAVRSCYDELRQQLRQLDLEPERKTAGLFRSLIG